MVDGISFIFELGYANTILPANLRFTKLFAFLNPSDWFPNAAPLCECGEISFCNFSCFDNANTKLGTCYRRSPHQSSVSSTSQKLMGLASAPLYVSHFRIFGKDLSILLLGVSVLFLSSHRSLSSLVIVIPRSMTMPAPSLQTFLLCQSLSAAGISFFPLSLSLPVHVLPVPMPILFLSTDDIPRYSC